ncbi:MAG: hypothetical protein A3G27_15110 [Betaproteobacteria bacterium RIFCSPLOWO2_12_FULL_66_14]|nr:MAG: hypothetical protein A3G27_15110 [Betaproteobacteria bacterium RIFCSPLOWO2_12_FULL_66_14]
MKIGGTTLAVCMALLVVAALGLWQWQWDSAPLVAWIQQHQVPGVVIYVVAVAASVLQLGAGHFLTFAAVAVGMTVAVLVIRRLWQPRRR